MADTQHNLTSRECTSALMAVGDALYVIGGKWMLRIIIAMKEGALRFNEIQRNVGGISARVLSNELKEMELNGFVKRVVHNSTPVVVEYQLTGYSDTLNDVLEVLNKWGTMHREKVRGKI